MTTDLETILAYTSLPVIATIVGGAIPAIRTPRPGIRSGLQHFAAGVIFAVVAAELLPDMKHAHSPKTIGLGFAVGVVVMLMIRRLATESEDAPGESGGWPWGLLVPVGIDLLIDGLLLGIGFAAGAREGKLLATGLAIEGVSLGVATAATFMKATGRGPGTAVGVVAALALCTAVGTTLALTLLHELSGTALAGGLAFGCAALLYLVTEELLVEAHEEGDTPAATVMFFAGFLLIYLIA